MKRKIQPHRKMTFSLKTLSQCRGQCSISALCLSHFLHEICLPQSTKVSTDKCGLNCSPASLIIQQNYLDCSPGWDPSFPYDPWSVSLDSSMQLTHKSFAASAINPPNCVRHHFITIWILGVSLLQLPNERFGPAHECWLEYFMTFKCVGKLSSLKWMLNGR